MDFKAISLYFAVAFAFLFLLRYILVVQSLLAVALKQVSIRRLSRQECPPHLLNFINPKEQELAALGFTFSHCLAIDNMFVKKFPVVHQFIYLNPLNKTIAQLIVSPTADAISPLQLSFKSRLDDGRQIITFNAECHLFIGDLPYTLVADAFAETTAIHLAFHLQKLTACGQTPKNLDAAWEWQESAAETERFYAAYLEKLEKEKYIFRRDSWWGIRLAAALKMAWRMVAGAQKAGKLKKKLQGKTSSLALPLEVEVENFINMTQALTALSFQLGGKLLFFGLSMVLFVGAFSIYLSLKFALMLLLILLLHEGGHLLAMRLTGHTNLSMLFIPLFGGVAMGSPRKVPPYKKIIALFAGPLPGVILAAICTQLVLQNGFPFKQPPPDLLMALILLVAVNYFNLIPILPLDGGQIFNLIIFSRLAFLQAAFTILSIVGLVILGVLLQAPLLFIVAVAVMLGFRQSLRQRRLLENVKKITASQSPQAEHEVVTAIFKEIQKPPFANMPFPKKFSMARYVDDQLFSLTASLGTTIATLVIYTIVFLLPFYFYYATPLHLFLSGKDICSEARRIQLPAGEHVAAQRFLLQKNKKFAAELFPLPRLCFTANAAAFNKNESILLIGRLWRLFGAPEKALNGYFYPILDRQSGLEFQVNMEYIMPSYAVPFLSLEKSLPILLRFEKMLNAIEPADYQLEFKYFGATTRLGCKKGQPFWDDPQAAETEE